MATYKVLQDIEAEDKLVGPLTLKQFIFAIITIMIGFLEFKIITTTGLSVIRWPFFFALLIPFMIFGFLAAPIGRDQPNDIWLLARLRFLVKPHKRIWNQDGISQLVTITAPKKIERVFTNGLDQTEVKSRLSALANTLDSRGWAVKNVDVNLFAQPGYLSAAQDDASDRLIATSALAINQPVADIHAADDILDAENNLTAQKLDKMMHESASVHRQDAINKALKPEPSQPREQQADYWFMSQAAPSAPLEVPANYTTFQSKNIVAPGSNLHTSAVPTAEEEALIAKIEAEQAKQPVYHGHDKTILPLNQQKQAQPRAKASGGTSDDSTMLPVVDPSMYQPQTTLASTTTPVNDSGAAQPNPAILSLASNDDLNVATIARQAQKISESDGEVVINLH